MPEKTNKKQLKGLKGWIPLFKAGVQTDSQGRTRNYSEADLDDMVNNHDSENPAPHVITHKELYSPFAYAQADKYKREGDTIFVQSQKIEPQFEKLVKDGRLYSRSIRINKTDNGFKIGHIAWLGAEPPAVDGLAAVEFNKADADDFDYSIESYSASTMVRMMRRMREFLIDQFSVEEADKVLPDYDIQTLADHAAELSIEKNQDNSFSKHTPTGDDPLSKFTQEEMDEAIALAKKEQKADFTKNQNTLQAKLDAETNKNLKSEFSAEVDGFVSSGLISKATSTGMSDFMLQLSDDEDHQFEFSVGDGDNAATKKVSPLAFFREFMKTVPKKVNMGDSEFENEDTLKGSDFNAPLGGHVDSERSQLHQKALDYQAKHDGCTYVAAVAVIEQQEG